MTALGGLVVLFAAAGFVQRGDEVEFWLPMTFGAVVVIAYAGATDIAAKVMGANP